MRNAGKNSTILIEAVLTELKRNTSTKQESITVTFPQAVLIGQAFPLAW